jgi:hypothetical protein
MPLGVQELTPMWLIKAEPKFTSTLRLHLAERGEEEPFATGSSAERVTVPANDNPTAQRH